MTTRSPRRRPRKVSMVCGAVLALTLTVAACGGDDDAGPAASTAESGADTDGAGQTNTAAAGEAPNATIAPDLPEELRDEIGPVEVIGAPLPGLARAEVADDPALGMAAPVLVGQNFDGETVRVDAATNGPTMVVFLAHWCPHCNAEVPRLNELRDQGAFPEDLNIVAVSTALDPSQPNFPPSEWMSDIDWTYPVLVDGVDLQAESPFIASAAYGVDGFPFTVADRRRWQRRRPLVGRARARPGATLINSNLGLG